MDSRNLWKLAAEHLPESVTAKVNLASTPEGFFTRLADAIDLLRLNLALECIRVNDLLSENLALEEEREEARAKAREYYFDVEQLAGEHQWNKHWARDSEECSWLKEGNSE